MNLKNILLSVVAIILSICLAFLLFIATNQNALAKVHRTISTFSKVGSIVETKNILNINSNHTAEASEKNQTQRKADIRQNHVNYRLNEKAQEKYLYSTEECKTIVENYMQQNYRQPVNLERLNETNQAITFEAYPQNKKAEDITINKMGEVVMISAN
ncbi:DNA replicative helicase MCM subunit Mcm2 (Cdc46/Mcm family) [Staphylococcus hominis]